MDAIYPSNTSYQPLPPKQQSFDWSPGDSVLACHLRSPAGSGVPDSIFLLRPGEAPEFLAAQWNVGAVVWLPTGALLSVDCDGQYTLLRPGAANAPADTSQRLWGVHLDHTRGSAGWRGLVSTASAPPGAAPIAGVPGWSTVAFDREVGPWLWWSARSRQFMGMQPNGAGLLRFDPMGRFVAVVPPRERGELYFTSVHDGALVVGVVNLNPESEEGPSSHPAFAWSIEGGWRAPIAGLEGGIEGASGSPAGDRVLMHTRRGVEFGRLVVDR